MSRSIEIRLAVNGYIVMTPWPYGNEPVGHGEVVCSSWADVEKLAAKVFHDDKTIIRLAAERTDAL